MKLQEAEEVLGMLYRGRRVYLEQFDYEKNKDNVKRDCFHFSLQLRDLVQKSRANRPGLIIRPHGEN